MTRMAVVACFFVVDLFVIVELSVLNIQSTFRPY